VAAETYLDEPFQLLISSPKVFSFAGADTEVGPNTITFRASQLLVYDYGIAV